MNLTKTALIRLQAIEECSATRLQLVLVALSALLAAQLHSIQLGWINDDSVLYFEAARLFSLGEWKQGFDLFPWPLYSLLINWIHILSGLEFQLSAQLLSIFLFCITTASFLQIIRLSGGNNRVLLVGALILFSSQYIVGDILPMLLRDQGFWAFFLIAIVCFIQFYRTRQLVYALSWQVSILIAFLFRIEAFTYLLLLPFILFFSSNHKSSARVSDFFKANIINMALLLVAIAIITTGQLSVDQLGRLKEIFTLNFFDQLTQTFRDRAEIMATEVLGNFLDEFAEQGLLLTFLFIILAKIISSAGIINTGLAAMAFRQKQSLLLSDARKILTFAMLIAALNASLIITKVFVLSGRYVVAFGLLLMIFSSFYLAKLTTQLELKSNIKKKIIVSGLLVILILGLVINVLPKRTGHAYEREAALWLKTQVKDEKRVFFTSARGRYYFGATYAGRQHDYWANVVQIINDRSINEYDYLFINMDSNEVENENYLIAKAEHHALVKEFYSTKNKKKIMIFKRKALD